jgi:hypothetical protein
VHDVLGHTDLLRCDAGEAAALVGRPIDGFDIAVAAALQLRQNGPRTVIVQAGDEGDVVVGDELELRLPMLPVAVVNATGGGDAFIGTLAALLARGDELPRAARFASAAAPAPPVASPRNPASITTHELHRQRRAALDLVAVLEVPRPPRRRRPALTGRIRQRAACLRTASKARSRCTPIGAATSRASFRASPPTSRSRAPARPRRSPNRRAALRARGRRTGAARPRPRATPGSPPKRSPVSSPDEVHERAEARSPGLAVHAQPRGDAAGRRAHGRAGARPGQAANMSPRRIDPRHGDPISALSGAKTMGEATPDPVGGAADSVARHRDATAVVGFDGAELARAAVGRGAPRRPAGRPIVVQAVHLAADFIDAPSEVELREQQRNRAEQLPRASRASGAALR